MILRARWPWLFLGSSKLLNFFGSFGGGGGDRPRAGSKGRREGRRKYVFVLIRINPVLLVKLPKPSPTELPQAQPLRIVTRD